MRRGHDTTVVTVEPAAGSGQPFRQIDIGLPGWGKAGRIVSAVRLAQTVRQVAPDVVHFHYVRGLAWGAPLVRGMPCVVTPWGSDVLEDQGAFREWYSRDLTRRVFRRADAITAATSFMEAAVRALAPAGANIVRIGWGVDVRTFRPVLETESLRARWNIGRDRRIMLSPRLARPFYRHERVIRALPAVRARVPEALLAISGHRPDAAYMEELRALVSSLGLNEHVRFLDDLPDADVPRWLSLAEVAVMVPPSDGMPLTLLETMAAGAVPVLNRLPQYAEWVRHGINGFLVGPEDDLTGALIEALADRERTAAMAKQNRALVEQQADQDREMERMEVLYGQMAAARAGR
jgi:glycosyltransferase involved in cell wall biosynthesis